MVSVPDAPSYQLRALIKDAVGPHEVEKTSPFLEGMVGSLGCWWQSVFSMLGRLGMVQLESSKLGKVPQMLVHAISHGEEQAPSQSSS